MNRRTFLAVAAGAAFVGNQTAAIAQQVEMKSGAKVCYPTDNGLIAQGTIVGFSHASAEHAQSVPGHKTGDVTAVVYAGADKAVLRFFPEQLMPPSIA